MKALLRTERSFDYFIRVLFFVSGCCSLIYEVLWARILHTMVGCSLHAVTLVMAAFMSGLALGSVFGGWLTRRQPNGLRVYAFLEAGIGLFAILAPLVFAGLTSVYVALHGFLTMSPSVAHALRFALSFLGLVVPAALMGATLPVLTQYLDRIRPAISTGSTPWAPCWDVSARASSSSQGLALPGRCVVPPLPTCWRRPLPCC